MDFYMDKQTFTDLNIFKNIHDDQSTIFRLFDQTATEGGKEWLRDLFEHPLTDVTAIRGRQQVIICLQGLRDGLVLDAMEMDFIEFYMNQNFLRSGSRIRRAEIAWKYKFFASRESYIVQKGVHALVSVLCNLHAFCVLLKASERPDILDELANKVLAVFEQPVFKKIADTELKGISRWDVPFFDFHFRGKAKKPLNELMAAIYCLDAYQSVASAAKRLRFVFPCITEANDLGIRIDGLFHPALLRPVANDVRMGEDKNLMFLTGSNMSGKTTFLKAFGIAVYLAHLGLPVPARAMTASVLNGLMTTINVMDNLHAGISFFYQEVMRVKDAAAKLGELNQLLVIFDELFKGTNVRDAYDASLAVVREFCRVKRSFFIISTHIVEIADELVQAPINYQCFKNTLTDDGAPHNTYRLSTGVSHERSGMQILQREHILEMIRKAIY